MISDRELFVQMLERDVLTVYENLSGNQPVFNLPIIQQMVFNYADKGIEYVTNLLFGQQKDSTIDEASDVAKFIANDKIEEYRKKILEQKNYTK